jgi:hypothetical protein
MKLESKILCLTSATHNVDTKEKHEARICIQCILYFNHGEILCNHVLIATRCMLALDSNQSKSAFTINWRQNWRWSYQMIWAQMRQLIFMHVTSLPVAISVDLFSRIIRGMSSQEGCKTMSITDLLDTAEDIINRQPSDTWLSLWSPHGICFSTAGLPICKYCAWTTEFTVQDYLTLPYTLFSICKWTRHDKHYPFNHPKLHPLISSEAWICFFQFFLS